jgi:amino acid adenylation domain-containing protein
MMEKPENTEQLIPPGITNREHNTKVPTPDRRRLSVAHLVAAVAATSPGAVALRAACGELTYGQLNARANRLARYLESLGVGPEVPVGLCLERSFDQITACLAVLKAGGAFLPLDPFWPEERIKLLLDDARAPVVITTALRAEQLAGENRVTVAPERDAGIIARFDARESSANVKRENLAYVIFTSGSTGEPKGVEVTHGNLLNLIFWHRSAFGITAADRASHLAGLGFDASIWEVWPYLTAGASVSLVSEAPRTSPDLLRKWLIDEKINIAFVPTALAEPMIAAEWPADTALRFLLTGADTLHSYARPNLPFAVVNNYGPTECAVVATSGVVPSQTDISGVPTIGRPIANTQIYLLNENRQPVAPGQIGEIYIGGTSVGREYRNRPQMTAERFLPDPFRGVAGARMYRTGDLGCLLPDGEIAFHGRIDEQEKIRGHRVEPAEIATALNRNPQVASSAVVARSRGKEKQLVAYVVPAESTEPTAAELRDFLTGLLPDYMIPAAFVKLASLPLTTSGKLDKKALPEPSSENALDTAGYHAPETPTERCLADIVAGVLGAERVGINDNFFLLGGHSLLGTQLVLRARDAFGVDLTLLHLFEAQTVGKLAATIERLVMEKLEAMSEEEAQQRIAG